jgi:uncharacterized membrane protein
MALSPDHQNKPLSRPGPIIAAATLIGVGMGGFVDGIVFHQILQWHNMLSAKLPPDTLLNSKTNMFWDGVFHAGVWVVTMTGIILLWNGLKDKTISLSDNLLAGGFLFGWGLFNVVEGIIDHHLLALHNVREVSSSPSSWNFGFLGISVVMLLVGWMLIKNGRKAALIPGTGYRS